MAQSRTSRNSPDLLDLTAGWDAMESINRIRVKVVLELVEEKGTGDLWATLEAWGEFLGEPEAKLLASVKSKCSATQFASLDTALFRALYALDGRLASLELGGKELR